MTKRFVLLAALLAAPAIAQNAPPVPDRTALPIDKPVTAAPTTMQESVDKLQASKALLDMMKPVWSNEQIGRIVFIGYHNAAAALCDGLEVDSGKMARAIAWFAPKTALPPARAAFLRDNLTLDIGLTTGWVMAGNFRDIAGFCTRVKKDMAEMPADKHLFDTTELTAPAK